MGEQAEDFVRLETAGFRHDIHARPLHMRHHVKPGAVAHRRRVQHAVTGRGRIHIAEVGKARLCEIAVGEHRAFRPASRARGVEQPGKIVAIARLGQYRVGGKQRVVFGAADDDQVFESCGRVRRQLAVQSRRGKAHARARMLNDVAELTAVQLGVGRHRGKPAVPDAVNRLDVFDAVLGNDRDTVAGL